MCRRQGTLAARPDPQAFFWAQPLLATLGRRERAHFELKKGETRMKDQIDPVISDQVDPNQLDPTVSDQIDPL
jgi:hypothetical protein